MLRSSVTSLATPGAFVAVMVSDWRVHDINFWVLEFGNFAFYFGLTYLTLTIWARHKTNSRRPPQSSTGRTICTSGMNLRRTADRLCGCFSSCRITRTLN
jgi:hypothetical protein